MSLTLGTVTNGFTGGGGAGATVTVSVTTSGTNRILIVGVCCDDSNQNAHQTTSVVFNGSESLTQLVKADSGAGNEYRSELWYLINPTATTANVVVTYDSMNYVGAGCFPYNGASQAVPTITNSTTNLTGASPSLSLTTTINNSDIVDAIQSQAQETANAGQTKQWQNQNQSFQWGAGSTKNVASAGSSTVGWTGTSGGVAYCAMVVAPSVSTNNFFQIL